MQISMKHGNISNIRYYFKKYQMQISMKQSNIGIFVISEITLVIPDSNLN